MRHQNLTPTRRDDIYETKTRPQRDETIFMRPKLDPNETPTIFGSYFVTPTRHQREISPQNTRYWGCTILGREISPTHAPVAVFDVPKWKITMVGYRKYIQKIGPVTVRRPRLYGQSPPIQNLGTCLHKTARARVHVHVACPPLFLEFSPTPNFGV